MLKVIFNLTNLFNRIINSFKKNRNVLPLSQVDIFLDNIIASGLIEKFEFALKSELNMDKKNNSEIDEFYGKRLEHEKFIYNFPLESKINKSQAIELAKLFFSQISSELSLKANSVIDGTSEFKFIIEHFEKTQHSNLSKKDSEVDFKSKEVYCIQKGDLRDLYNIVHEISHTFDVQNGDTDARRIFGEIVPQCMERLLDEFLLNLNNDDLQKYGLNRNTLIQDIRNRKISTFLSRKDNILDFNKESSNKEINLRYILAQIYSTRLIKLDRKTRVNELLNLIKNIEINDIKACSKSFGIDLENVFATIEIPIIPEIISNINKTFQQVKMLDTTNEILKKVELKKNFYVTFNSQDIYISLESKIPYVLILPAHKSDLNTIVMESNNLEATNIRALLLQALETGKFLNDILLGNNPIFVPILPSPSIGAPYYQQLSNECFQNGERPDLDVIDSLNEAKEILMNKYNMKINKKIFLNGYSSSGVFAQRFSFLHPELISKVCIGGASGSIPIPIDSLDYPLGIKNFETLFENKFNLEEYRKILFYYYVGEHECDIKSNTRTDDQGNPAPMHDMSYFSKSVPQIIGKKSRKIFGNNMFERVQKQIEFLQSIGININHKILPNIAHNFREAQSLNSQITYNKNIKGIDVLQKQLVSSAFTKINSKKKKKL